MSIFDKGKRLKAVTDGGGKFELRNVRIGKHTLKVECDGYGKIKRDVEVGAGNSEPVNMELGFAAFLKGRVLDYAGNPIEKVWVRLACKEPPYNLGKRTKYDGRYAFDDLPAGNYTLTARKEGYCTQIMQDLKLNTDNCVITMVKAESIKGYVLDAATGKPVERFRVAPMELQDSSGKYRHIDLAEISNKNGVFEIHSISPKRKYKNKKLEMSEYHVDHFTYIGHDIKKIRESILRGLKPAYAIA